MEKFGIGQSTKRREDQRFLTGTGAYTDDLSNRTFLLQEAIGDEQVPNMTTRILARSRSASGIA